MSYRPILPSVPLPVAAPAPLGPDGGSEAPLWAPGVDPEHQKIRSVAIVLPVDVPYKEGAKEALIAKPGIAPATV